MRLVYKKDTKSIVTVIVDDNSITSFPPNHCVLQSDADTLVQMALALGLNMPELIEYFETNNIDYAMTPELEQILKDRAWGINFGNTIIDRIKNTDGLTAQQRLTLLNTIKDGMNSLQWGDMNVARAVFNAINETTLYDTTRKNWVLQQIDNYLLN